jgi:hypothetical protein
VPAHPEAVGQRLALADVVGVEFDIALLPLD